MWMIDLSEFLPCRCGTIGQVDNLRHMQIAENAMMRCLHACTEQAEENKPVPHPHAAIGQMCLRRAALAQQTFALVGEHGIVMAQPVCLMSATTDAFYMIAQPQIGPRCARISAAGYRQADRVPIDNR